MATIKVIFRESSAAGGEGALYFRIIHRRKVRQLHTGIRVARGEWDDAGGATVPADGSGRREYLRSVDRRINDAATRLRAIVGVLDRSGEAYSVDDIAGLYLSDDTVGGFISYARRLIKETAVMGRGCTADHYASALNSFIRFHGDGELPFDALDSQMISGYECYLKGQNLCPNTTSYYMRNLRAIYNQAVEQELASPRNPFRHVYTGVAPTVKRAVPLDKVRALRRLDLRHDPVAELARDLFIFSFFTRGMAFVDMAFLRKTDIRNGVLVYRRHKTNRQLNIRWEQSMQEIADRHRTEESEFLFPLIKSGSKDYRRQYLSAYQAVSRRLRRLGEMVGMSEPLTFHRSRHAWASIARNNNVPISVIKEGMGHDSERTTQIYLASLDSTLVDNANRKIIGLLDA